ncbi:MAG: hypothetical protein JSV65_03710 [Armatimonadota bacterium]|nr:MAG: hypothetical protein JSV65_03710 [Armatimonadota bacterium]
MHTSHTDWKARLTVAWLIVLTSGLIGPALAGGGAEDAAVRGATLCCRPNLPVEGEDVVLTFRAGAEPQSPASAAVTLEIRASDGTRLLKRDFPSPGADGRDASLSWRPRNNGLYRAVASAAGEPLAQLDLPVVTSARGLDLVWYRHSPWIRWATVIASAPEEDVPLLRRRGIKALKWTWGSNHPALREDRLPLEQCAAEAERYYGIPDNFQFDGYGMDEFGGYPQTQGEERAHAWLRGLIEARRRFPEDFVAAAWHGGGVRDEWVGLYKQAADLLLLEAYEMYYAPRELGTENIFEDLRGRLIAPRGADLFTRAYRAPCKVLLSLDLCGKDDTYGDAGELEQVIRFIRREFPEMRGIAFFNGSDATEDMERAADRLCFDYFIRPVITFQPNSLWLDRFSNPPHIVVALSNIGGMDGGPVTVRLKVNGRVVGTQQVERVPAGGSRLTNRAFARWQWSPRQSGVCELEAQILAAPGSAVLNGRVRETRWIAAGDGG